MWYIAEIRVVASVCALRVLLAVAGGAARIDDDGFSIDRVDLREPLHAAGHVVLIRRIAAAVQPAWVANAAGTAKPIEV